MSLNGAGIVITRPIAQAKHIGETIERAGGKVILFPTLEIVELDDTRAVNALIDGLEGFDWAIFISQNAAEIGLRLIRARRELPARLKVAAIGEATRAYLVSRGVRDVLAPAQGFDSEALLALPQFENISGKRVAIFRGVGGRETLRTTLEARGASVEYAECYARRRPAANPAVLLERLAQGGVQAVSVMSRETLNHFCEIVDICHHPAIKQVVLFAPHVAIAEAARKRGFCDVQVTGAGDAELLRALEERFCRTSTS